MPHKALDAPGELGWRGDGTLHSPWRGDGTLQPWPWEAHGPGSQLHICVCVWYGMYLPWHGIMRNYALLCTLEKYREGNLSPHCTNDLSLFAALLSLSPVSCCFLRCLLPVSVTLQPSNLLPVSIEQLWQELNWRAAMNVLLTGSKQHRRQQDTDRQVFCATGDLWATSW